MAYRTYITEAIVCGSSPNHTSDRSYLLFTREAGMLYAAAKSVREERSKQRYALQEFSHLRATLVHGKTGWRIAGVEPIQDLYAAARTREQRTLLRNVVVLLRRLMHGETPYQDLFDELIAVFLHEPRIALDDLELIVSLRMLAGLGYVASEPALARLLIEPVDVVSEVALAETERIPAKTAVLQALNESQL